MKQKDPNRLKMKSHKNFTTNTIFSRSKFIAALSVAATLITSCENKSEVSLSGRWRSHDNELFPVLEFKEKSTIVISTFLGDIPRSYERDGAFIRVLDDTSDIFFEIVSKDSIIGHDLLFVSGVWVREN